MAYAELHCKTNFSFLEGASHPDELVVRAAELGYHALAITDRNSLAGVVRAHVAAKDRRLKLLIGAEVTPDDAAAVVLWVTDRSAYGRLCRLFTRGRMRAPKGECQLHFADIAEHAEGLLAGVLLGRANMLGRRLRGRGLPSRVPDNGSAGASPSPASPSHVPLITPNGVPNNSPTIARCSVIVAMRLPNCITDRRIDGSWRSGSKRRSGAACRWWRRMTFTTTRPPANRCRMC